MSEQSQRRAAKNKRRYIRKRTIITGGRKIPGLPFMGEMMTCLMCGKTQQSDPKVKSDWRMLEADGVPYYVCVDHFPPDDGTKEQFASAYVAILTKIAEGKAQP